mgnify:CR=1 FL=1
MEPTTPADTDLDAQRLHLLAEARRSLPTSVVEAVRAVASSARAPQVAYTTTVSEQGTHADTP